MDTSSWSEDERDMDRYDLGLIFESTGRTYGLEPVRAAFRPFKEFKVQWQRSGSSASFLITDYLRWAEPSLLDEFADSLCRRQGNRTKGDIYPPGLKDWLRSQDFVGRAQPLYLDRSQNLARRSAGRAYDLRESYERLRSSGLVQHQEGLYLSWTKRPNHQRVGYCSALMRVIAISSLMDTEMVPGLVSDYVLYHELLHMEDGLSFSNRHHGPSFRRRERMFPRWEEAERILRSMAKEQRSRAG